MSDWHHFIITNDQTHGNGAHIFMDGEELRGVQHVKLEVGVNMANTITIQMVAASINADVPAEVKDDE